MIKRLSYSLLLFMLVYTPIGFASRLFVKRGEIEVVPIVDASGTQKAKIYIDNSKKRKRLVRLVRKGVSYLHKHGNEHAFHTFRNDEKFVDGDAQLFVVGMDGTIFICPPLSIDIWRDLSNFKNAHDINVFEMVKRKAVQGGGWVDYEWDGGYKYSYVELVRHKKKSYIIGAGWYPITRKTDVKFLIKNAIAYFKKHGSKEAFEAFSDTIGDFAKGDLYIFAYDSKGVIRAHGLNQALVGVDLSKDKGVIDETALVKKQGNGWVEEPWRKTIKMSYVEGVKEGEEHYIIGGGYYPETHPDGVIALVKRGVGFFYSWGREKAAAAFNEADYERRKFISGEQFLILCRFDGTIMAHGDNPKLVGQNLLELKTPLGRSIVKEAIELAKKGGGWLKYRWNNALFYSYIEKVKDTGGEYFIANGYYPHTPVQEVENLVSAGIEYVKTHSVQESMYEFSRRDGDFLKGSYELFVFDMDGNCLVFGKQKDVIWKNFKGHTDPDGVKVFDVMLDKISQGGGWFEHKAKNTIRHSYAKKIMMNDKEYIIGSGFYI